MTREEAIGQLKFMLEQMPGEPPFECDYIEDIEEWLDTDRKIRSAFKTAIKALEQEPKPKTGYWIDKDVRGSIEPYCSVCGDSVDTTYHYNYCPNCGARMAESEEA